MTIYTFGDSWGYGAELKTGEIPFGQIIANKLNILHVNYAVPGISLGNINFKLFELQHRIKKEDIVLIVIPPDTRWYGMRENGHFKTITMDRNNDEWNSVVGDKPLQWFEKHHLYFVFAMQELLKRKGCKFMFMCNYGKLNTNLAYGTLIDTDTILSDKSLSELLTGTLIYKLSKLFDGPFVDEFSGKYFEGTTSHPNQLGHYRIAELINDKMKLYDTNE